MANLCHINLARPEFSHRQLFKLLILLAFVNIFLLAAKSWHCFCISLFEWPSMG